MSARRCAEPNDRVVAGGKPEREIFCLDDVREPNSRLISKLRLALSHTKLVVALIIWHNILTMGAVVQLKNGSWIQRQNIGLSLILARLSQSRYELFFTCRPDYYPGVPYARCS